MFRAFHTEHLWTLFCNPISFGISSDFAMLFQEKKRLLELYNALNGTHYTDPDLLEVNTLENAICLGMQNDLSFLIDSRMYLYEHQSTLNPNMPLRFLFYVTDLYSSLTRDANLYGGLQPGTDGLLQDPGRLRPVYPAGAGLRGRDAAEPGGGARRNRMHPGGDPGGIFKREPIVVYVSIYEYDAEKHIRQEKEESWDEGFQEGRESLLIQLTKRRLKKGKSVSEIAEDLEQQERVIRELIGKLKEN